MVGVQRLQALLTSWPQAQPCPLTLHLGCTEPGGCIAARSPRRQPVLQLHMGAVKLDLGESCIIETLIPSFPNNLADAIFSFSL